MTIHFGSVPAGSVLPVHFGSYNAAGASVALTGLAITDVEIFKGTMVTQRASDAGVVLIDTDGIDIDGIAGANGFSIDTGDNTDAGFYTVGSFFNVWVSAVTIDTQTVNFLAATFRIVAAEAVAGKPKVDVDAWLGTAAATPTVNGVPEVDVTHWIGTAAATPTTAGVPEVDITHIGGTAVTAAAGIPEVKVASIAANAITATAINADAITAAKIADGAIDAATFAADAITAAKIAADVGTEIGTAVWATAARTVTAATNITSTGGSVPITAGGLVSGDVTAISTDTAAADNAEAFFDGTGYAGTGNAIPTVTAVTTVNGLAANTVTAAALAADAGTELGTAVWATATRVLTAGTNLNDLSAAAVNAEVVDALSTDTYAEPGQGSPAATATLAAKIGYLYKAWRNKHTQTSSEYALYADDTTTKDQEAVVADDGTTFSRGEVSTGA